MLSTISYSFFRVSWALLLLGAYYLCWVTFTLYVVGYTEKDGFVFFRTNVGFLLAKPDGVASTIWMTVFYFHVTSCIICLILGPFQFIAYFRKKYSETHRLAGKLYIGSILLAGAPSGFYMSIFANGGLPTQLGFIVLSFLWTISTYLAYQAIRERNFKAHMAWTARSYALTFSAVTLRVWTPILSHFFFIDHDTVTATAAWLNWIPNLIITELIIRYAAKKL